MRVFAVYNALVRTRRACCWLRYEPSSEHFSLEIAEWAGENDVPFPFDGYLARGQRLVEGTPVRLWAFSRTVPADRENLQETLEACNLSEYYLPALIASTKGRSSHDDFLFEEVRSIGYQQAPLGKELEAGETLGEALGRARRAAGITQSELAEVTGIQQAAISRLEQGHGNPTLETLELVARGIGRTLKITLE